jgi:dolichol-phosphate mannosyltransferase
MLSLILPTYNERKNLEIYLPKLISFLNNSKLDFEILIVDDNSPDLTWELAEEFESRYSGKIRGFRRMGDRGLSSAILFGFVQAKGDFVCVLDADMQHDEEIIPDMLKIMISENLDLVVGSRKVDGGGYGEMPGIRKFISKLAEKLAAAIMTFPVRDTMSGFFMMRRASVRPHLEKLNPKGFKILLEILGRIPNLKTKEIGYNFKKRNHGKTKLNSMVIIDYLSSLIEIRYSIFISPILVMYSLVGILGVFINLFTQILAVQFMNLDRWEDFPSNLIYPGLAVILGFEISVISNFLFNHFWTFSKRKIGFLPAFFKFQTVSVIGFFIQFSTWAFLYNYWLQLFPDRSEVGNYLSNFLGILFAFFTNFSLNRSITWRKR